MLMVPLSIPDLFFLLKCRSKCLRIAKERDRDSEKEIRSFDEKIFVIILELRENKRERQVQSNIN